jgi:hypothetical protein
VTKTGLVVGTPEYMSPEQLSGDKLDGRSDIYSLGLVLYRMLTGVLPFQADSAQETMIKRLTDDPIPLEVARPDIAFPPKLQAVLDRALARMPSERYQRAAQFGNDVMEAVAGLAVPETRADIARVTSAATQLLDTESALKAITTRQAAKKGPPAAAPEKKFPLLPVLGGVAALAAVAVLAMGRGREVAINPPADTTQPSAPGPVSPNQPQPTLGARDSDRDGVPDANDRCPSTAAGTPVDASGCPREGPAPPPPDTTGPRPAAAVANWADTLQGANDAFDADEYASARRLASAVFAAPGVPGSLKARAAVLVATTYAAANDLERQLQWYRNALRYEPNNQRVRQAILDLGGELP